MQSSKEELLNNSTMNEDDYIAIEKSIDFLIDKIKDTRSSIILCVWFNHENKEIRELLRGHLTSYPECDVSVSGLFFSLLDLFFNHHKGTPHFKEFLIELKKDISKKLFEIEDRIL